MQLRVDRLKELLAALPQPADCFLSFDPINIRYLTGFTGSSGAVLINQQDQVFITDFRYTEQAHRQIDGFEIVEASSGILKELSGLLRSKTTVAVEEHKLRVAELKLLKKQLSDEISLVDCNGAVEQLRLVKDQQEIERIAAAADLIDEIYSWLLERGVVGSTERQIATEIEYQLRKMGAEGVSFAPIVASGQHGALPHAEPRNTVIEANTLVVIDCGAQLDGYCSDCTRTFATGQVSGLERDLYELVLSAQEQSLANVTAGAKCSDIDQVARDIISEYGYGDRFGHSLGHGVGLEVHERPQLASRSSDTLTAGNVVTVEPGVYLAGQFGIRIEDLVVVTEQGQRVLSNFPKAFTCIE